MSAPAITNPPDDPPDFRLVVELAALTAAVECILRPMQPLLAPNCTSAPLGAPGLLDHMLTALRVVEQIAGAESPSTREVVYAALIDAFTRARARIGQFPDDPGEYRPLVLGAGVIAPGPYDPFTDELFLAHIRETDGDPAQYYRLSDEEWERSKALCAHLPSADHLLRQALDLPVGEGER